MPGEGGRHSIAVPCHMADLPAGQPEAQQQAGSERKGEQQRENEGWGDGGRLRGHEVLRVWAQCRPSATIAAMSENPSTATPALPKSDQNLVWLDCEMTGLDPETERLLEIAVVVTGPNLEPRVEGPVFVIHQTDALWTAWTPGTRAPTGAAA